MTYIRIVSAPHLLSQAQNALGHTQESLGRILGISRKTMGRWQSGHGSPSIQQWAEIARWVHARNPDLAARIASEMGESLVSLGIVAPIAPQAAPAVPVTPPIPTSDLVDSIVCAAAEAVAMTPQAIRPAVLAAFDRAASVRMSIDDVRATLRPAGAAPDKGASKKKKSP
jgi:DNA-binding XRE family transcriptional regulator